MNKRLERRYLFLSFSAAFLTLSLLILLMMTAMYPRTQITVATETTAGSGEYIPTREDAMSVLFVGVSSDGAEAESFLLARFDPARGSVPLAAFPLQTEVQGGGKTQTLAEAYRYGGASYARDALAQTLGLTVDRYVRFDEAAFVVAAATVGTIEYDLQKEVPLEQEDAVAMTLSPGVQLMDGQKVASLITYQGYEGGELERCGVLSDLAAAIVDQRIDIALSAVVDKVFEKIINLVESDISYADYADRKEAAACLARKEGAIAAPVTVRGEYVEDGSRFLLSDTFVALLTQVMV